MMGREYSRFLESNSVLKGWGQLQFSDIRYLGTFVGCGARARREEKLEIQEEGGKRDEKDPRGA